jgi:hypothetical protein
MASLVRRVIVGCLFFTGLFKRRAVGAQTRLGFDEQIMANSTKRGSGKRVDVYSDGPPVDAALVQHAEQALAQIEQLTGRPYDAATLGPRIAIYLSASTRISHVWKGYDQPQDPRGILFLSLRAYRGALTGEDATYAHELAHLVTWRFYSHTLREGLADYLALQIHPGGGVGPNQANAETPTSASGEVKACLATTVAPPPWLASDAQRRREYYWACRRFVQFLIDRQGMSKFMALYDSREPEKELPRLYGAERESLVRLSGV